MVRTIKCHAESCTQEQLREDTPILPWLVKGRDGWTPFERLDGQERTQEFVPFGGKVSAECIVETSEGVFSAREVRRLEQQDRCDKGESWTASGLWTGRRYRLIHCHHHQCLLSELQCRGRESPGRTSKPSEPLQDARVAIRSDLEKRAQAHSDPCCNRIEERLKTTPEGAERVDRRSEVLNEALAKEVERNVRRRRGNRKYSRRVW